MEYSVSPNDIHSASGNFSTLLMRVSADVAEAFLRSSSSAAISHGFALLQQQNAKLTDV
jgi:hypothetical protein